MDVFHGLYIYKDGWQKLLFPPNLYQNDARISKIWVLPTCAGSVICSQIPCCSNWEDQLQCRFLGSYGTLPKQWREDGIIVFQQLATRCHLRWFGFNIEEYTCSLSLYTVYVPFVCFAKCNLETRCGFLLQRIVSGIPLITRQKVTKCELHCNLMT